MEGTDLDPYRLQALHEAREKGDYQMNDVFSCNKAAPQFIIYTSPECPKCEAQKKQWDAEGIGYVERDSDRIKNHQDEWDSEALVEASMGNMELPVIVKI